MANYLGISQELLSKIERGKDAPTIETLFLLSERFRKSIDWILRGSNRSIEFGHF
jgi:transcriptional regulator with XRE-family HTH domain